MGNNNNKEVECLELILDILSNRPKDLDGKITNYTKVDREKYREIINAEIETVNQLEELPLKSKGVIVDLYKWMLMLFDNGVI